MVDYVDVSLIIFVIFISEAALILTVNDPLEATNTNIKLFAE
jgi:hypothetical protein